ncbi:hypothetical protein C8Q80DRAFT_515455 [Daedaleopsis nitida]|nr:hypothetical protein C8Q80DRAFT_515455 [Daedaleopsis nitida]
MTSTWVYLTFRVARLNLLSIVVLCEKSLSLTLHWRKPASRNREAALYHLSRSVVPQQQWIDFGPCDIRDRCMPSAYLM